MADESPPVVVRYGRINKELIGSWMGMSPDDGGPFWALNLMKYRDVADYGDQGEARSGREADDAYTPRESLGAIGAQIVFAGEVERVVVGDGMRWDRVGIVRYPTRKKFLEMQQREDFKKQHVHKDAGMEFTIVMSCLPRLPFGGSTERHPFVEMTVTGGDGTSPGDDVGVFDVEGVIVGDERRWATATFRWLDELPADTPRRDDDASAYRLLLRVGLDRLSRSVEDAAAEIASQ